MRFWLPLSILMTLGCGGQQAGGHSTEPGAPGAASGASETGGGSGEGVAVGTPHKGRRALETRKIAMDFDLTLSKNGSSAGVQTGSWSIEEQRTIEVVEAKGDAVTKLSVIYGRREAKPLLGIEHPTPTAGKSYLVTRDASGPVVTHADGSAASDVERNGVAAEYGWVGAQHPLLTELAGAHDHGAELQTSSAALKALVGDVPAVDLDASRVHVRFGSMKKEEPARAELDVEFEAHLESGGVTFELALKGPAEVELSTGFVSSLKLEGKVTAKGTVKQKKGPLEAQGKGTATLTRTAEIR